MNTEILIAAAIFFFLLSGRKENPIGAINKSSWFDPYTEGKPTIPGAETKSGVYFIKEKSSGKIVYVGSSVGSLKKTIYRHFQIWNDRQPSNNRQFERMTYPKEGYSIRVIYCTAGQAIHAEKYFIRKLQPRDNPIKYNNLTRGEASKAHEVAEKMNEVQPIDVIDLPF